jgi:ubiquitin C
MKIKINPMFGKEFELLIQENDKIKTLKTKIKEQLNFNSECQIVLSFQNKLLEDDDKSLSDYTIKEGDIIKVYKNLEFNNLIIDVNFMLVKYLNKKKPIYYSENETLSSFKDTIQEKINVPKNEQILIYKGIELQDNKYFKDYNIENKSVLYLFTKKNNNELYVETPDSVINIEYSLDDTIENIKMSISKILSIPIEKQQLYHEGIELKNNQKIFDYNCFFNQNLLFYLVLKLKIEIQIEFNRKKYITVYTKPNETIESIKKIIENKENYPAIYMDLIFKNQILENQKLISDYQIENNFALFKIKLRERIKVTLFNGNNITIYLENDINTIEKIKNIITQKAGLDSLKYRLMYGTKQLINEKNLKDYNIKNDSCLSLIPKAIDSIEIFIIIEEKKYTIDVKKDELVENILLKFPEIIKGELYLKGEKLEKNKSLKEYNIQNGDNLTFKKIEYDDNIKLEQIVIEEKEDDLKYISIKNMKGNSYELKINKNYSLKDIKEIIKEKEGIPLDQQILCIGNKTLDNNRSLADYNIREKKFSLTLMIRLRGG